MNKFKTILAAIILGNLLIGCSEEQSKQTEVLKPKYIVHQYNDAGQLLREWKTADYIRSNDSLIYFKEFETNKDINLSGGIIQAYEQ